VSFSLVGGGSGTAAPLARSRATTRTRGQPPMIAARSMRSRDPQSSRSGPSSHPPERNVQAQQSWSSQTAMVTCASGCEQTLYRGQQRTANLNPD